ALEAHAPAGAIWTAWPATAELSRPELGYVARPLAVHDLEDFSAASLAAARGQPAALYLFSRIYEPRRDLSRALPFWASWARRYFGFSPDAPAAAWLERWRLQPIFHRAQGGQWVTVAVAVTRSARLRPGRAWRP
ncbi:MAG: hypothetical protein ACRDOE_09415, partial [Streptosporangiaceae bacterium]